LVDLFKGEQQKNADFSLLKGLKHTHVQYDQSLVFIYDIVCQYIVYILERIGHLLPANLIIDAAIGLFHVHAHKEQCFFQFAPTFIPGTGIVAGEILESLWSNLNSISPMARTATLANRAETLDDHATDSNHKKAIGMVATLCRGYRHAIDMLAHAKVYYENLTTQAGERSVEMWTEEIERAENERRNNVKVMDIYAAKLAETPSDRRHPASGNPTSGTPAPPLNSWMELSLRVEEKQ
jgi:Kyakuja-Dileera-Zisupton transposase